MKLLAFDTSTERMDIAVQHGSALLAHSAAGGALASTGLLPAILKLMAEAGLAFGQLDAIVFGQGPGSFTGLRTACSVAQGLAFAADVPVLPVSTLLAIAQAAYTTHTATTSADADKAPTKICATLDARMGEIYYQYYEFNSCLRTIDGGLRLNLPQNMVLEANFENCLLAGNVRPVYDAQLQPAVLRAPYLHCLPTAPALLQLAPMLLAAGHGVAAQDALPLYMRDKVAFTTLERAAAAQAAAKNTATPALTVPT